MKIFALFLCTFLLLLCGGTLTYIYLLWTTYWAQMAKYVSYENRENLPGRNFRNIVIPQIASTPSSKKVEEVREKAELDLPMDKLMMHVNHYKTQIVSQLRSAVIATGKSVQSGEVKNIYGVNYQGKKATKISLKKTAEDLVCSAFRDVKIRTFLQVNILHKFQKIP